MATSGSKSVKVTDWDTLKFSWSQKSQSVPNNTTTISWKLELIATEYGYISSSASKAWSVTVNGTKYSGTASVGINNNSTKTLASGTTTISHNADGSKSFSYSFSQAFDINFNGWVGTISGSGSGTLNTIPRASQPSCITWPEHTQNVGKFGDTISIHMNRASDAFTHTVRYQFGTSSGTIATGVATGTTWKIPKSLMTLIPNTLSGSGTIYVDTYNGSTLIGTKSCGFTATVPTDADCYPVCSIVLDDVTGWDNTYGSPVQGLSKIKIKVNTTLAYGSPIASYSVSANGAKYTTAEATTDILKRAGNSPVTVTVKDKRGRTASASYTMNVLAYNPPSLTALSVHRVDADNNEDDQGEYIWVQFSAEVTALGNKNTATYTLRYKQSSATTYTTVNLDGYEDDYILNDVPCRFLADTDHSYDVELSVKDNHGTYTRSTSASTAFTLMNWGADGTSMAIGKVAEKPNTFEVGLDMVVDTPVRLPDFIDAHGRKYLTLTADFKNYSGQAINAPWCRMTAAGVVEVWGAVSPTKANNTIGSGTATTICTLPDGYCPTIGFYHMCQGSGLANWVVSVAPDGTIAASRYRTGGTYETPGTSTWMPFHFTFIADY